MFERNQHNPRLSAPRSIARDDPWHSHGEPRSGDQGVWILSYLDVMMILFAFFVLLFAYQKSLTPSAISAQKTLASSAEQSLPVGDSPPLRTANSLVAGTTQTDSLAVSAMKAQSAVYRLSKTAPAETRPSEVPEPPVRAARMDTDDAVAGAARLALDQTGQWIAQTLREETEGKQVEVLSAGRQVRLELSETILFEPASADLSPGGFGVLDKVLPILREQRGVVFIEGHTDNTPIANTRYPSNWELSTARATAVTHYLIGRGIASDRLRAVGLADTHPRSGNDSYTGRARNRRVSLVLGTDRTDF